MIPSPAPQYFPSNLQQLAHSVVMRYPEGGGPFPHTTLSGRGLTSLGWLPSGIHLSGPHHVYHDAPIAVLLLASGCLYRMRNYLINSSYGHDLCQFISGTRHPTSPSQTFNTDTISSPLSLHDLVLCENSPIFPLLGLHSPPPVILHFHRHAFIPR